MRAAAVTASVIFATLIACSPKDLKDDAARTALELYAQESFCAHFHIPECVNAKVASLTSLRTTGDVERDAGAKITYESGKKCETEVKVKFTRNSKGGWVLSRVEGMVLCGGLGTWSSPPSFEQPVK